MDLKKQFVSRWLIIVIIKNSMMMIIIIIIRNKHHNLPHFNLQFMSRWTVCLKGALMLLFLTTQVNSECKSDLNRNTEIWKYRNAEIQKYRNTCEPWVIIEPSEVRHWQEVVHCLVLRPGLIQLDFHFLYYIIFSWVDSIGFVRFIFASYTI